MGFAEYHKIDSVYKRDQRGRFIEGEWSRPEFGYLARNEWEFTEKVDGTNIRLHYDGSPAFRGNEHAYIAGRTDNAQLPPFLLDRLINLMREAPFDEVFPADEDGAPDVTLYGEGYGARIQKGGGNYISDGVDFVLFDVNVGGWWLQRSDVEDVATKLGLDVVPIVGFGTLHDAIDRCQDGFRSDWPNVTPEGLVCRPVVPLFDRGGKRIITKVKLKDFS